jgi:glycosyltransferase involved in cell wall biosynthesis
MTDRTVGIDIEQFMRDPYATGIQRVLQYLAREWPADIPCGFVVPVPHMDDAFIVLDADEAAELLSLPFAASAERGVVKDATDQWIAQHAQSAVTNQYLHDTFDAWLLPEVSYLPSVVGRFESFRAHARTSMIGYDILPMIEPANYRFSPGRAAWVSEYFRMLAVADAVVCISDYSRRGIVQRLRRPAALTTVIAHPGGDHVPIRQGLSPEKLTYIRVGTMEARKMPLEILDAFLEAVHEGLSAELIYVGMPSASDTAINEQITRAIEGGLPVRWVQGASDSEVYDLVHQAMVFLSIGVEGYGIPVLEAIRLGTPVLYAGEQPAAELMEGKGAQVLASPTDLRSAFHVDAQELRYTLKPELVPSWREFTGSVATFAAGKDPAGYGR